MEMSDLISRKWLTQCVEDGSIKFDTEKDTNRYIHLVRDIAPSADAVEVVRCKDCYHYDEEHSRCLLNNSDFKPTDYCSYGSK